MQNTLSLRELAKPYFFKADNNLTNSIVILVHGFGASATETRPLGEFLKKHGYDVYGILLPGHGTSSKELDKVKWEEWYRAIEIVYQEYRKTYSKVFIGGVSLGGALSLYSSSFLNFTGVFTINAICGFSFLDRIFINVLRLFKYHKPRSKERIEWYKQNSLFAYHDDPIFGAYQILKLLRALYRRIDTISAPVLLIQSQSDKTINPQCGNILFSRLVNKDKELFKLPHGDHILTVDPNRTVAFEKILSFLQEH